jgi:hypothetical protein
VKILVISTAFQLVNIVWNFAKKADLVNKNVYIKQALLKQTENATKFSGSVGLSSICDKIFQK